ncbi:hypothetical protein [Sagittula sp. S175]|uniref:hypothetical protein n=1 Tax=Sagittula sp. S175 TaxID=3415129 RepID=UPI003C7B26EB
MGLLNVIRRMALREKLPIREIARRTGLSRNTIKKLLDVNENLELRTDRVDTLLDVTEN